MSYLRTPLGLSDFTPEQEKALLNVSPAEIRELPVDRRVELAFMHLERESRKSEAFWTAVEGVATGMIPILIAFGLIKASK